MHIEIEDMIEVDAIAMTADTVAMLDDEMMIGTIATKTLSTYYVSNICVLYADKRIYL